MKKVILFANIFLIITSILLGIFLWNKNSLMPDSFEYLRSAETFISEGRYLTMNGYLQIYFPPGYPFFVAIFYFIFHNFIVSAKIVSLVSSTICVIITLQLGRRFFNEKVALLGSGLFLLLPLRVCSSLWVLSDTIYVMWLYVGFYFLIQKKYSVFNIFFSGLSLGFAYLTRPEAVYYAAVIIFYLIFVSKVSASQKLKQASIFLGTFLIVMSPYLFYLRYATGIWQLSGKTPDFILAIYRSKNIPEEIARGMNLDCVASLKDTAQLVLLNLQNIKAFIVYHAGIVPLAIFFVFIGFLSALFSIKKRFETVTLQILIVCGLLICSFFWVETRFLLAGMPLICLWCAEGLVQFSGWAKERLRLSEVKNAGRISFFITAIFCAILMASYAFRIVTADNLTSYRTKRVIIELAKWINENKIEKQPIYSNHIDLAYFTGMRSTWVTAGTLENVYRSMKERHLTYLVFTSNDFMFQALEVLRNENNEESNKYFKLIKKITVDEETVWFYKIL